MTFSCSLRRGTAVLLSLVSTAAVAQTAKQPASEVESTVPEGDQLTDIVVTAQRREESLQRVPVAVTVASGEALRSLQIVAPAQLVNVAPSLQQQSTAGEQGAINFSIRGVGTNVFGAGVESSVAIVLDDVTLARPQFGVAQFFDLANVQILRGPQGQLFGKNAAAGVVSINTTRPQINVSSIDAYASVGTHDSIGSPLVSDANITANVPVSDTAAARISAFGVKRGGLIRSIGPAQGDYGLGEFGGRVKLLWKPTAALELYFAGDYAKEYGAGDGGIVALKNAPGGALEALQGAGGLVASRRNRDDASNVRNYGKSDIGGLQLNARYSFDSGYSLTNIAAYRIYKDIGNIDVDQSPASIADILRARRDFKQFSEELRLASPTDGSLKYQVGLYYLDLSARRDLTQFFNLGSPVPAGLDAVAGNIATPIVKSKSYAAFGQADYTIVSGLSATIGARYTHDESTGYNNNDTSTVLVPLTRPGFPASFSNTAKADNLSYKVGLNYSVDQNALIYVSYARGYKGPALDEVTLSVVRPEIPKSLEAGAKTTFFDRRLSFNVAAFRTIYRDFQAQAYDPSTGAAGQFTTLNAGSLRVKGVEADFRAIVTKGLTINGGAAYVDGIYTSFTGAPCYPGQPKGTSGRFVCLPNSTSDVSGGRLANAPRFTFNLAGQYEADLTGTLSGFVGADLYHRSSINYSVNSDPQTKVPSLNLVGLHVGIHDQQRRWDLQLFARNVFDKRFPTYIAVNPIGSALGDDALGGDYYGTYSADSFRTIGVSGSVHF